jgi:hypothetical protein
MGRHRDYFVRNLMQAPPPQEYQIKIDPDPREAAEKK